MDVPPRKIVQKTLLAYFRKQEFPNKEQLKKSGIPLTANPKVNIENNSVKKPEFSQSHSNVSTGLFSSSGLSLSSAELKKYARDHCIPGRSKMSRVELANLIALFFKEDPSPEEWAKMLGDSWIPIDHGIYMNEERSTIIGQKVLESSVLNQRQISEIFSYQDSWTSIQQLPKRAIVKNTQVVVPIQNFYFKLALLQEAGRLLGPGLQVYLNPEGFLLCRGSSKFALIAPLTL